MLRTLTKSFLPSQGKVSREDIAELCVQLLSQQEGLDKTFEVKSTVPFSQPFEVDQRHPPASRDWQVTHVLGKAAVRRS